MYLLMLALQLISLVFLIVPEQRITNACQLLEISTQYKKLDSALSALHHLSDSVSSVRVNPQIKKIEIGDSGLHVMKLRASLYRSGLKNNIHNPQFDSSLLQLVRFFQFHHGLSADGIVGKQTIAELNINMKNRLSMARAYLPTTLKWIDFSVKKAVIINIPAYMMYIYDGDRIYSSKVIVGKEKTRTIELSSVMKEVIINPFWDIPKSILYKEIIPELRRDTEFLERNHMEWVGDRLRQLPGDDNALGKIKFNFTNPYNIYLHDTPAKELFSREIRAFSHGCIRVQGPIPLALFLLKGTEWAKNEVLDSLILSGKEKRLPIQDEIRVEVIYLPVFVDADGHLQFRKDIYKKR